MSLPAICQPQDLDLHITNHLLAGKTVLKVKRDLVDLYLWVLTNNNGVYRINSATLTVDDYTANFAAFSNDHFFDIAGKNKDVVVVASKSKLVECNNAAIAQIVPVSGSIPDPINSIDMSMTQYGPYLPLLIGTDKAGYAFTFEDNNFRLISKGGPMKLLQSSYNRLMYTDYTNSNSTDITKFTPVTIYVPMEGSYYVDIFSGGIFGSLPNTALYTLTGLYGRGYNDNLFWGTDNGMFQLWDNNYNSTLYGTAYNHYLDNVKVNKITNVLGLITFGSTDKTGTPFTKQNLLIGTSQGLYFSSSLYQTSFYQNTIKQGLDKFSLFHFDALGNIAVNDVYMNVDVTDPTSGNLDQSCENGIWLGTGDGVYLLKPDYKKYLNPANYINAAYFNMQGADALKSIEICEGATIELDVNQANYANLIQWKKDGVDLPGENKLKLNVTKSGDYSAILYAPCNDIHLETNHLKVTTISAPLFTFDYQDKLQYCDRASTILNVTANPFYNYRWYTNGVLNGNTTAALTVTASGKYKVEVSACTNTWIPSKEVQIDLINLPVPTITADKQVYCNGDIAELKVDIPIGITYTINWYRDGVPMQASKNLTTVNTNAAGSYTVSVVSNIKNTCLQTSAPRQLDFTPGPVFTFDYEDVITRCDGENLTLQPQGNPAYQYRWYKNGVLTGDNTMGLNITASGKYKVEVSACNNSWVPSKEVEVDLIHLPDPQITSDLAVHCAGSDAVLNANILADAQYTINWYRDGTEVTSFKNNPKPATGIAGVYTVAVKSNTGTCAKPSAPYSLTFVSAPVFTFDYQSELRFCKGAIATLEVNGSPAYKYRWYKDGILTGDETASLATGLPGNYKVEVSACLGNWTPSKEIKIDFIELPLPVISADKSAYCIGDVARLNAGVPAEAAYTISWLRDGIIVNEWQDMPSVNTAIAATYSVIISSKVLGTCMASSLGYKLIFYPQPTAGITPLVSTSLCEGQPVDLAVNYSGGTVLWADGETTDKITVSTSGNYKVTVTSPAGCQVDAAIDLHFLPKPVIDVKDIPMCTFSDKSVTLIAPAGFAKYTWNGYDGNATYMVDRPQTVTLTVTNANGCQASQQIRVISQCPDIHIPNAFTPNNDGKNDTWVITGMETDPTVLIKVFNRYGNQVYESKGYLTAWNGTAKGNKLPAGVYYYSISAKNGKQSISGSVTLLY